VLHSHTVNNVCKFIIGVSIIILKKTLVMFTVVNIMKAKQKRPHIYRKMTYKAPKEELQQMFYL